MRIAPQAPPPWTSEPLGIDVLDFLAHREALGLHLTPLRITMSLAFGGDDIADLDHAIVDPGPMVARRGTEHDVPDRALRAHRQVPVWVAEADLLDHAGQDEVVVPIARPAMVRERCRHAERQHQEQHCSRTSDEAIKPHEPSSLLMNDAPRVFPITPARLWAGAA